MFDLVSRAEARRLGLKRYFTGQPCLNGHLAERKVCSANCVACHNERHRPREQRREEARRYRAKYPEKVKGFLKRYYDAHPDRVRAKWSRYYAENIDRERERAKAYNKNNPERCRATQNRRRARQLAGGSYSHEDVARIVLAQKNRCALCRTDLKASGRDLDHIIPLARGGTNLASNLQLLCPTCNRRKGAKHPVEFARMMGLLL